MRVNYRNMDFWSGLMLAVVGLGALLIARDYPIGTVLRMGSGYFPTILSGILIVFGIVLMLRAFTTSESIEGGLSLRALLILPTALCLFGFLLDRAGFIPAMLVIVIGSALAGREFRFLEVVALAIGLTAASVAIFIFGLGLPYPLYVIPHIPGF